MLIDGFLKTKSLSSLTKVFADQEPIESQWEKGSMLRNEVYSFQVAYSWSGPRTENMQVVVNTEIAPFIEIRLVGLIPCEMPGYADHDDNVLRTAPGLYPDLLIPPYDEGIPLVPQQWRSLWLTIQPSAEPLIPGTYPIEIIFRTPSGDPLGKVVFYLEVIDALLPKQKLLHTEWFHTDCIATYYGLEVFSEAHWHRIGQFMDTAVKHGINMILTPLFTPPLDTAVGAERPTVQLVDVEKVQETYHFGFDRLKRWVDLCHAKGVEYFEFSHLFTQWGAKHAPKIIATESGAIKQIFGWDTDAAGVEYESFLSQFLPELLRFIELNHLESACYFHVSDEPHSDHLDDYKKASALLNRYLKDYPIIDALSDYNFYETGVVKNPIPASNHIGPFLKNEVPNLWTYYCCSQYKQVSNRFINMPSARNRILGIQLYKFRIKGFLQWGYNFWYSKHSKRPIDPFRVTDAGYAFPSGDAFVVYPGVQGPLESLRLEVFYEALQDLRALELLEAQIGRDAVLDFLEEGLTDPITFSQYPKDADWLLTKREQINQKIVRSRPLL